LNVPISKPYLQTRTWEGIIVLNTNPKNNELDPITKHKAISRRLNGTVFMAYPANWPIEIWIMNVAIKIIMNSGLLKKSLKTLI
jgi:hypothetical protein